jgi:membrane protein implicated in regulation of membrane protease activity
MPAIPWWAWAVLAAAIGLAELHVPGSYLIWIALGAALTAAADAAWDLSISAQIGVFAGASALSCIAGYFVYRKVGRPRSTDSPLNQRNLLMVGARGIVCTPFVGGRGKVRLDDSVWLAEGPNLAEGTPVTVTAVRGARLLVVEAGPGRQPGIAADGSTR